MSVAVSSRTDLLGAATVIKGILDAAGSEVQCIELIGEYFPDLADESELDVFLQVYFPTVVINAIAVKILLTLTGEE